MTITTPTTPRAKRRTVFETNYERLEILNIITDGVIRPDGRSTSGGLMDLVLEHQPHLNDFNRDGARAFSLTHYFEQNGDLCRDPDMVLLIHPDIRYAEAFSFEQSIPPIYQEVYPEPGRVYPRIKSDLNAFLRGWLTNLIDQGFAANWADRT